ncbi:hypothetical protein BK004_02500 [bacterium CG10_46_32]|nr:MAG: hypothetical protein BK004_02500 [bacterium CG10_46_32]
MSAVFVLLGAGSVFAAEAPIVVRPFQGQEFDSPVPVISGEAIGASEVLVFVDSVLNGVAKVSGNTFSYTPFLPLGSGGHAIQLQARDSQTKELSSESLVTLITIIPNPSPTLLVPYTGDTLGQDRVWAGGVAQNNSLVRVVVDGKEQARVMVKNHASGTGSFSAELKNLLIGEHTITAIARDSRGKESFISNMVTISILPPTPAPILFRPIVNADSGIDRPFIAGIAKNGFVVSIIVDGKIIHSIPLGEDPSGVINFAWQPQTSFGLGRHTIEAYASDRGKLSNNSAPIYWQVGDVALVNRDPEESSPIEDTRAETEQMPPISVTVPDEQKPLTVKDDLVVSEEPIVPDVVQGKDQDTEILNPEGRVVADDDAVLGATTDPDMIAQNTGNEFDDSDVMEITPGAVVRQINEVPQKFTFNTSLVIGIVILVFLLLSILVWYIQEKRAQLGERVVNIFREDDETGHSDAKSSKVNHLPGDIPTGAIQSSSDKHSLKEEKKKKNDSVPPPPEPPRNNPPSGFGGPEDLPPPPPPMF